MDYDVIIIGGSYAGLSAGLPLARARRSVLVIDAGVRRNRFARASHGFLTQDGASPDDMAAEGRAQLMEYETVEWLHAQVETARPSSDGFEVHLRQGGTRQARRLILATGVRDELPPLLAWPNAGGGRCSTAPTATAMSCSAARSACWRHRRCRSTRR